MTKICSEWLIYTGIISLVIGFIMPMMMGIGFNLVGMFTNTYSMLGYILLVPGILIKFFKRRLSKVSISAFIRAKSSDDAPILTGDED